MYIFEELQNPADIFSLCVCSIHFWMVGVYHLKALHDEDDSRENWAGDRIICMGDYAKALPECMLTNAEIKQYELERQSDLGSSFYYAFADMHRHPPPPLFDYTAIKHRLHSKSRTYLDSLNPSWWTMWAISTQRIRYHYDQEFTWVLRNLSKKVYVRADKLPLKPEHIGRPWEINGMSFGTLVTSVTSRIAWSSEANLSMEYCNEHNMHRGVWAEDRFDVVNIREVEEGWEDVSAEAKKELRDIWKSEFGDNWAERVVKLGL